MVASSQPLATDAGLKILAQGGNAADSAVAVAAALNVTEPTSTGLGGDMFALFYEAASGKVRALNGSGRSPACLSLDYLQEKGLNDPPPTHALMITVPGACAGWCDLVERHGSLDLGTILAPAIALAEQGFPVQPITSYFWTRAADKLLNRTLNGRELTIDGRGPAAGENFTNPGLAKTLKKIAAGGRQAYYEGEIVAAIVAVVRQAGGCLSEADLAAHASSWETPISTSYQGLRLWECPPNGQGLTALLALNILDGFDLPGDPLDPHRLHLEIEALRLAFADARWYIADPSQVTVPVEALLSRDYADRRRRLLDPVKATINHEKGTFTTGSDTIYFCVVDRWGNACSFINSNYMGFGTGILPHGWGFSLQNRGANFSLQAGCPNALAPGKRPYHTIIPAMITRQEDGSLVGPMGVMGGFMQPQGHLQVFLALAQGYDPQAALDLPRFCLTEGSQGSPVALEEGIASATATELERRGHTVKLVCGWERALFGRGQVILRDHQSGMLAGGSDLRADGCARALL